MGGYAQAEWRKPVITDKGSETVFDFPESAVIYLEPTKHTLDVLRIGIWHKGIANSVYEARVYKLLEHSLEEIEYDKLYILTPFYVMKPRRELLDGKSDADRRKELAQETAVLLDEITDVLDHGILQGIITKRDMVVLQEKTYLLYQELYSTIAEFKEALMDFEKKFRSKIPALEAEIIKEEWAKIIGLFKQGKTVEEVETLLAQEAVSNSPQPAMI